MSERAEYRDVDPGEMFICEGVHVSSGATQLAGGAYEPRVLLQLQGRWNKANVAATVTAVLAPDTAIEFAPFLSDAAEAAVRDAAMLERLRTEDLRTEDL